MKKALTVLLALLMVLSLAACGGGGTSTPAADSTAPADGGDASEAAGEATGESQFMQEGDMIGVSLISLGSERWVRDSDTLREAIEGKGYECMMQYCEDNTATQVSQIQNMVLAGAKAIIVCPYDNGSLSAVLKEAREAGVIIINYDLAVVGSGDVDYFVGYDNREVGVMQANAIIEGLGLDEGAEGPFYIEMFAGSLNEANCYYYFDYAMETLAPYFESGQLICKSGEDTIEQCTIIDWNLSLLTTKLDGRIAAHYSDGTELNAVLVPSDYFSGPIAIILKGYGYGEGDLAMPIITGNDCYESTCKLIAKDMVYMTVLKDTTLLSDACMYIIDSLNNGTEVEGLQKYQPRDDYDFELDAYFVEMFSVTKDNLEERVIDTGFFTEEQVYGELDEDALFDE